LDNRDYNIKLQQDIELAIDCFFVNKNVFFANYSTKICFTVSHITKSICGKLFIQHTRFTFRHGFRIVVLSGDHEFAALRDLAANHPTMLELNWVAASQHRGLIEQNICFLKEKICSLHHSLPFEKVPVIMVACMVLHVANFFNGFPC
jgi:hypothetical protein